MDEQRIRTIAREEIDRSGTRGVFNALQVPRHIHNGVDSPVTFQPQVTFAGIVNDVGVPVFLPKGWSVTGSGATGYTVTHNLGTDALYSVVANTDDSSGGISFATVTVGINSFYVATWDASTLMLTNSLFTFLLTLVNNKSQQIVTYEYTPTP